MGGFLARTKLDEVPQLWNVLRGEMSLVGPRPEDPGFVALHEDDYRTILQVRPGVTGLCQLAFAKESAILDPSDRLGHYVADILPQKVRLDVLYARTRSFRGDLRTSLLAFVPVALGTIWTYGAWGWAGEPLDLFSLAVTPILLGLGVDHGLHVLHRVRAVPREGIVGAVIGSGRAMALSTLTTCVAPSSCRSSTSWRIPACSPTSPPPPSTQGGTASSCGTTSSTGSR